MTPEGEEKYQKWLLTFSDIMKPEDAKLFVIRKPSDIVKVFEELDDMGV